MKSEVNYLKTDLSRKYMEKLEKKESVLRNIWTAIKSLGVDDSSEEKEIAKQLEELEKVQKKIHEEQENFGASLRVTPVRTGKAKTKTVEKTKKQKQEEREIGE